MIIDTLKPLFTWPDRRPITALHLCGSQFKTPDNPQGWNWAMLTNNTGTPRLGEYANWSIDVMKKLNAQGCIVWDIEGQADYQTAGYLGSPDIALSINPDVAYDKFFRKIRYAGLQLKVGVCLRPCEFNRQTKLMEDSPNPYETLKRKAAYARSRWGCKLFYVDTNTFGAWGSNGILPATIWGRLRKVLPDCLFIPEHTFNCIAPTNVNVQDRSQWLYSAPYVELRMGNTGTRPEALADIPQAFSVINVSAGDINGNAAALKASFARGDIPLINGWWAGDPQLEQLLGVLN